MIRPLQHSIYWFLKATVLGAVWAGLFRINAALFKEFAVSDHASWIFLPAALRVLMPLVFRSSGVGGLILGSLFITPPLPGNVVAPLLFAIASGLAPVIGIAICQRIFRLAPDLAGLSAVHLSGLSILCALSNSLCVNFVLFLTHQPSRGALNAVTVFVGDVTGTAMVIYAIAGLLTWTAKMRAS